MKEYVSVQVNHQQHIGSTIDEYQSRGWHLHTYQTTGCGMNVAHYLLFEKDK